MSDNNLFDLKGFLGRISIRAQYRVSDGPSRFDQFIKEFDIRFPDNAQIEGKPIRLLAIAALMELWDIPLELLYLGHHAAVIVEVHGFLERLIIDGLPQQLTQNDKSAAVIKDLLDRMTLSKITDIFKEQKIWSSDDCSKAYRIVRIRNGIAHKNLSSLSKLLTSNQSIEFRELPALLDDMDSIPYFIDAIYLLVKWATVGDQLFSSASMGL